MKPVSVRVNDMVILDCHRRISGTYPSEAEGLFVIPDCRFKIRHRLKQLWNMDLSIVEHVEREIEICILR